MRCARCFRCERGANGGGRPAFVTGGALFAGKQERPRSLAAFGRRCGSAFGCAAKTLRFFLSLLPSFLCGAGGRDGDGSKGAVRGLFNLYRGRGLHRAGRAVGGKQAGAVRPHRDIASCPACSKRAGVGRLIPAILKLTVVIFLVFCMITPAYGVEEEQTEEEKNVDSFLSSVGEILPDAALPYLPEDITDTDALREAVGFRRLLALAAEALKNGYSETRGGFVRLLGITLLFSAAVSFGKSKVAALWVEVAAALALFSAVSGCSAGVTAFFSDLSSFASLLSPLYTVTLASGGAVATSAAAAGAFTGFITVLDVLATGLLGPLVQVLLSLTLLSALGNGGALRELTSRLSGLYVFLLSLIGVLLTAALAFEGSLASSADSMATRTVKFAIGNALPVVGGTVSSLLGSLSASLSLIKSAMGAASLIVILSLCLPLLCELFLWRTALSLCDGLAVFLGAPTLGAAFGRFRKIYDLMLAGCAIVSVLFLLTVGLLSRGVAL